MSKRETCWDSVCHRDGTVTYWSVYRESWVRRAFAVPDEELAAMNQQERARVIRHLSSGDAVREYLCDCEDSREPGETCCGDCRGL